MKILSSKNADQKISATAIMTSSQAKSSRLDSNSLFIDFSGIVPTSDVKNCFYYLFHNTSFKNLGIESAAFNNKLQWAPVHVTMYFYFSVHIFSYSWSQSCFNYT
jgi:hypothetical protein